MDVIFKSLSITKMVFGKGPLNLSPVPLKLNSPHSQPTTVLFSVSTLVKLSSDRESWFLTKGTFLLRLDCYCVVSKIVWFCYSKLYMNGLLFHMSSHYMRRSERQTSSGSISHMFALGVLNTWSFMCHSDLLSFPPTLLQAICLACQHSCIHVVQLSGEQTIHWRK